MRLLLGCLLLSACGETTGPDLPATSRLEYCGYDETLCEEPALPPPEPTCGSWVERWSANGITYIVIHVLPDCP